MKRTLGFILALILLFSSKALAQEPVSIVVSDADTKAGKTVELVLTVRNSPGISGAGITVTYDTSVMNLTDIRPLSDGSFLKDLDRSNFSWLKGSDLTGDFDLVKLCFEVSDRANGTYTVKAGLTGNLAANITNQKAIPVSAIFVAGTVTVEKNGDSEDTNETSRKEPAETVFKDIPADTYYYDAVNWAMANGITEGTSATTFSPNNPCTRAQMATFLWRAAGTPEPVGTLQPFADIPTDAYYVKAVQWAYEQSITEGTSATTFSPNNPCTRAQMATFLWRAAGTPEPVGTPQPFADIPTDAYYVKAVQWAYEQSITGGTSATTFSPNNLCTRAQMATFLYRFFVK